MKSCIVEMFGLSREVSGLPEIEVELEDDARLGDVVAALRRQLPVMEGPVIREGEDRLEDYCIFNINGQFYHDENDLQIRDGERLRLLSLATGG
ncbi:MAG: MoaD/ThiS family protein [Dehalococcoidales bacterium]